MKILIPPDKININQHIANSFEDGQSFSLLGHVCAGRGCGLHAIVSAIGCLRVVFRVCLRGRLWPVTDLAETWCGDSGHPKKSLETHIFEFGPTVWDLERIFPKNVKFVFWL